MSQDSIRDILQPALLDRLIGDDRRGITMRRLRECVLRDLSSLLNAINLESTEDLAQFPYVAQSVLNFGIPNLVGLTRSSVTPARMAERVRVAIELYEPRLSRVRVTPDRSASDAESGDLAFRIEAELWGDPLPQHMEMRTRIDLGTGNAQLDDLGGR